MNRSNVLQDLRRPVKIHLNPAFKLTSNMNILKLVKKKYRISWKQSLIALKKFKNKSSKQKSFKAKLILQLHASQFWNLLTVKLNKVKNKSSKLISNFKRN